MPGIRDLNGKRVLVTGAGSGIGRASAIAFAKEGARVVVSDIDLTRAEETASEIGGSAEACQLDASDREAIEALAKDLIDNGGVDVLFNNAGILVSGRTLDASLDEWEKIVGINFWSVVYGVRAFLPHMIERGSGHIVSTASCAGLVPFPSIAAYTATKHAVLGMGQALRAEVRPQGVGVSTICPGIIKTNIVRDGAVYDTAGGTQGDVSQLLDRWGRSPDAVAKAVVKAVKKDRGIVPVGIEAWILWYILRLSPGLLSLVLQRPMARTLR